MKPFSAKKRIIGRVEKLSLPAFGVKNIYAKIDTGADVSAIWASNISEKNGELHFKLFAKGSHHYTGKKIVIKQPDYMLTRIANSFGHSELRYVVRLQIKLHGKIMMATFTLSDRSKKTYPILIGRKFLYKRFLVDVSKGTPLKEVEDKKKAALDAEMKALSKWEKSK